MTCQGQITCLNSWNRWDGLSAQKTAGKFVLILTWSPAPLRRKCTGFPAPALFLREDGKDEKEETVSGQPAGCLHVQVYLSPSCMLWTSWYRSWGIPKSCPFPVVLPEWRCVSWKREKNRNRTKKEKKQGVIFPEFLPPQPESFSFTSLCSEWEGVGCTRGCSDFSPREERPCARGNQHSECQPCLFSVFAGISW